MGALKKKDLEAVLAQLAILKNKMLTNYKASNTFSNHDIATIFMKSEDVEFMHDAYRRINLFISNFSTNFCGIHVIIDVTRLGGDRFAIPKYAGNHINENETTERFKKWVAKHVAIEQEFMLIARLIEHLNDRCTDARTLRFVFPPLLGLATEAGLPLADKIRELKMPRYVPRFHPAVPAMIERSQAVITKAMMVSTKRKEGGAIVDVQKPLELPLPWLMREPVSED